MLPKTRKTPLTRTPAQRAADRDRALTARQTAARYRCPDCGRMCKTRAGAGTGRQACEHCGG